MTTTPQTNTTALVERAVAQGWLSAPQPMKPCRDKWVERNYSLGLTARGTPRKTRPPMRAAIITQAKRDGVGVSAIYNRIKRTGQMTLRTK